jgi:integrase/recombinase XerD
VHSHSSPRGERCAHPYLENGGRLEHAQQMAGHESPRTTKLYDRTKDEITIGEVERIQL